MASVTLPDFLPKWERHVIAICFADKKLILVRACLSGLLSYVVLLAPSGFETESHHIVIAGIVLIRKSSWHPWALAHTWGFFMCLCPWRPEEGIRSLGAAVTGGRELASYLGTGTEL